MRPDHPRDRPGVPGQRAHHGGRITRAKKKIRLARIPYRVPPAHELPDRLDAVLTVVHLLYTTGHTAPAGDRLVRADLVERSLDLVRMLHTLMPDDREVRGLLALLLLTDARRATRTAADGRLLLLEEQDRSRWNRHAIGEGRQLVDQALRRSRPGRFTLQAAIAAVHAEAPSSADTDWPEVLGLYDLLLVVWPSPVVALNRAVAVAMVEGPAAGLAALDAVADDLTLLPIPTLRLLAPTCYAASAEPMTPPRPTGPRSPWPPTPQKDFLTRRLAEVTAT